MGIKQKKSSMKKKTAKKRILPIAKRGGILPILPLFGVLGSLAGGAAGFAKAVNDSKAAQRQLEEMQRYNPYANTTFGYSDEIWIPIQHQDLYTLPCVSFLYVEGKLRVRKVAEGGRVVLGNNCVAFMFDELRYELDGVEIDRNRNVEIISTIKNYVSLTAEKGKILENAAWNMSHNAAYFNFCVPLNLLLGFCEDYKRVVINACHELVLIRSRNDNNCIFGHASAEADIELFKTQWPMPHVILSEVNKLSLLRAESGRYLNMRFRSWDLYEFLLLHNTTKHSWTVKAASQLEKPRYVIYALQTGRKNAVSKDITTFDDCKLTKLLCQNKKMAPMTRFDGNYIDS
ncbi:uncharacterized protein LOC115241683 [Formica exsecta]|uniref:uncharacterized protein LOC115241683 n=1 Tax=Formica exsecta TaxID=72781 RepID=UPI001141C25B|nr:uncharacterized protein LOC115241683 [Formica exsecta]